MYKLILSYKEKEVVLGSDGRIYNVLQEETNLELQIVVPVASAAKPMHLMKKGGEFLHADMKVNYADKNFRVYSANFRIVRTESGFLRAIQKHNGKNFIIIDCGDGSVRKAGIVSQGKKFYLLDREVRKEPLREETGVPFYHGVVEWFDVFSGVGCVKTIIGQARFYWQIFESQGLIEPKAGEWIVFTRLSVPFVNTAFQNEIVGNAAVFPSRPDNETFRKAYNHLTQTDDATVPKGPTPTFTAKLGDIAKRNG